MITLHERLTQDNWTIKSMGRDAFGDKIGVRNQSAVAWCLVGHVRALYRNPFIRHRIYKDLAETIRMLYPDQCNKWVVKFFPSQVVIGFNDSSTFEEVQRVAKVAGC